MRTDQDIVQVRMSLVASISLDLQRIEEDDPVVWQQASEGIDLEDPVQKRQAIFKYLGMYLSRELLLTECPSTNGPGEVWPIEMEVVKYGIGPSDESTRTP
jgi:hypothetical protein